MNPQTFNQILSALDSENPSKRLVKVILELKSKGWTSEQVYDLFTELLREVDGEEEDLIRDIMDRIIGWCAPDQRIFDESTL